MPGGRPSKYEEYVKPRLLEITALCRDGYTMEDIAKKLGIAKGTLYEYQNKYKELKDALKKGREVADIEIENALFKSALGYTVEETVKEEDEEGNIKIKTIKKYIVPSQTAQIFWLKNRKPDIWNDRKVIEANTVNRIEVDSIKNMSTEEIKELLSEE